MTNQDLIKRVNTALAVLCGRPCEIGAGGQPNPIYAAALLQSLAASVGDPPPGGTPEAPAPSQAVPTNSVQEAIENLAVPLLDHVLESSPDARDRVLNALPPLAAATMAYAANVNRIAFPKRDARTSFLTTKFALLSGTMNVLKRCGVPEDQAMRALADAARAIEPLTPERRSD